MRRFVILSSVLIALAAWAALSFARPPDKPKEKEPPPVVVPEDAIIAIFDRLSDALEKSPRYILLTPERYQALLDDNKRLERLAARTRPRRPAGCKIKGKVVGNLLTFTAEFEFETEKAGESVRLACGQAQATGVSLDGPTPRLRRPPAEKGEAEGFLVEIDKPGEKHSLTLDLVMAVASKAGSQGLTLDLPRAAITTIDLELPERVRDVRLGGKPLVDTYLTLSKNKLAGALGPVEKLDLTWQQAQADGIATVLLADGDVTARLDGKELTTEARLTLRVQSGQVKEWRLLVPPKAELIFSPEAKARIARVEVAEQKLSSLRTIHLKAPTGEPLVVEIKHTQPAPQPATGKAASVGPFVVLGAARHAGSLLVRNAMPTWHPEFVPHGDLTRRSATDEEQRREPNCVAAFRYGPGGGAGPWLDIEVERVRGQIETKASHKLQLRADAGGARWHVLTSLEIAPRWADVDHLTVQWPPGWSLSEEGQFPLPERVQSITEDPATHLVTIRLARGTGGERSLTPIVVELEGVFTEKVDLEVPGKVALGLPVPAGTSRGGGSITITTPVGVELLAPDQMPAWPGSKVSSQTAQEVVLRYARRAPASIPLSWRPHRPEVVVANRADVTLTAGEVRVRQELHYSWPAGPAPSLKLRVPAEIVAVPPKVQGGRLVGLEGAPGAGGVKGFIPDPTLRQGQSLVVVFEYGYPLPAARPGTATTLPLVAPVGVTRGEARVRLWSDPGHLPGPAGKWAEQNIEVVPGRARLPVLVLHSSRVDLPLDVSLGDSAGLFALVDRSLVRVEVKEDGSQKYRVSYRLSRLDGRSLDFELPAPASTIQLQASLDGKQIAYNKVEDADRQGRLVRFRVPPAKPGGYSLLEIAYDLDAYRLRGSPLTTPLVAPKLLGEPGHAPTRWSVVTPPSYVVLGPEMGATPRSWSRRGWLLAPRIALPAADLERWLLDADPPTGSPTGSPTGPPTGSPSLVLWHDGTSPVRLVHVPQQVWLLVCSLGMVLVGLLMARLVLNEEGGPSSLRIGLVLSGFATALVVAGLFVPNLLGQLAYGCQPGVLVLVVLVGIQRLLHERYRRQIVFLPSFTRASRKGSSLHRAEPRPHGQPSTVDAPRPMGSSTDRIA